MATRAQQTKVGIFLLITIGLFAAGALYLTGFTAESTTRYRIQFDESVLGLGSGGLVVYKGLPVGAVENMYVDEDGFIQAWIAVNDDKVILRKGVEAQLVIYTLATGTMAISLEGGDIEAPVLPEGSQIPVKPSLIGSFTDSFEGIMSRLEETLDAVNKIALAVTEAVEGLETGQLTAMVEQVEAILRGTEEFVAQMNTTVDELGTNANAAITTFNEVGTQAKGLMVDLEDTVASTNKLINTTQEKLEPLDIAALQESVQAALGSVGDTSTRLGETLEVLERMGGSMEENTDNLAFALREMMETANEAMSTLNELGQSLQQDPASIIRGRGQPRR